MTWALTVVGGSAVLGYLGSRNAAKAQESAAAGGRELTERMYGQNREDLAPWRRGGAVANSTLLRLLGIDDGSGLPSGLAAPTREQFTTRELLRPEVKNGWNGLVTSPAEYRDVFDEAGFKSALSQYLDAASRQKAGDQDSGALLRPFTGGDLAAEPGYQFGLDQGLQRIDQMGRARGMNDSGSTMKALLRYNQDYAGTKFNDAFNRNMANRNSIYSMLSGVSNTGANAAGQTANLGASSANMGANLLMQGGDARASGTVGGINAVNQGLGTWLNYKSNNDWLKAINNRGGAV